MQCGLCAGAAMLAVPKCEARIAIFCADLAPLKAADEIVRQADRQATIKAAILASPSPLATAWR
ncbi:hypothetical protein K663_03225 [Sphingobium sp. MI1205]|nr:hypothetical protein K663_03225 [Sphingobium sp. MI1205]